MSIPLRCLRPCLRPSLRPAPRAASSAYLRFYSAVQSQVEPQSRIRNTTIERRHVPTEYPRINPQKEAIDYQTFHERYRSLARGESSTDEVVVRGRIWSSRVAGSKLAFIDLFENNRMNSHRVQFICNYSNLSGTGIGPGVFKIFLGTLHRGDVYSVKGVPHRTPRNELSVQATEVPQLLSRCLHPLPHELEDQETKIRNRHVDLLLHPRGQDIIRLRSHIIKYLRQFLENDEYVEVQTPIIADTAGGAVARPFQTDATEFQHRELALRIAPELWLKRLILGGFDKVFEIGPSFRNEGIDLNHNPEFTTCEFYKTYADLEELIKMTEAIFLGLSRVVAAFIETDCRSLSRANIGLSPPYKRLDFIPAIEAAVGSRLPNLILPDSQSQLIDLFNQHDIPLPTNPTIPLLLDKLSATYLEPQCVAPTWIIYPPECLSPLSKSFLHPDNTQRVAARAELFIDKQEFVNTYEEENAPMEQRRKFEDQLRFQEGGPEASLDESYLQALEWGLPPTGGWGCGIDRLCMLFAGTKRIADVLAFGNLRNVVALRQNTKKPQDDSNEYDVPLSSLLGENQ